MEHKPFPPDATKPPQSKFPWPLVALAVAVVLLIAVFWLTPRTDKAATNAINSSTQPSPQVRIADVRISPQNVNGLSNVDVYGQATNTGSRPVTQAIVSAIFRDKGRQTPPDATRAHAGSRCQKGRGPCDEGTV